MNSIESVNKFCLSCMREHDVDLVQIRENDTFRNVEIDYSATYEHCRDTDELLESEALIRANSLAAKDAYRKKVGLLTSGEIRKVREKYGMSQSDFSKVLNWGEKTITRYENHQVQDRAHDDILRKIDSDPKWLLDMLKRAKADLSKKAYNKYLNNANEQYSLRKQQYLVNMIYADYASIKDPVLTGYTELQLEKVVDLINLIAGKVDNLYKVKLMKLLWYSDMYNYKKYGKSITGLAYLSLQMGAVPLAHDYIINLDGVCYDVVEYDDIAYKFRVESGFEVESLSKENIESADTIVRALGDLSTNQIIEIMHEEEAYKDVPKNQLIQYTYAEQLSID